MRCGENTDQSGQSGANWNLRFSEQTTHRGHQNVEYLHGIAVSWAGNKSHRASASSYAAVTQALFYGFDMSGVLKGLLSEITFGNIG